MNEGLHFALKLFIKGLVTTSITFFSVCASIGFKEAFIPSLIAGGLYMSLEAGKYLGIQPKKKVNNGTYSFII